MDWLWVVLGVAGVLLLAIIISSLMIFHICLVRTSRWNSDNSPVVFSFDEIHNQEANKYFEWFHKEGKVVYIKSKDGLKLAGVLFINPNAKRNVIMFHGYRGKPDYDFCLSHHWAYENGCNVLCIYQRSSGLSEGKYITMGIKERQDAHLWVNYVEQLNDLPIYLMGISMGAATVMMSFYKPYSNRVKGAVADCGYYSIHKQTQYAIADKMGTVLAAILLVFGDLWAILFAHFSFWQGNTKKILKHVQIPFIFAHGDKDNFVRMFNSEENYKACASKEKTLLVGKGADHGGTFLTNGKEYKELLLKLFEND